MSFLVLVELYENILGPVKGGEVRGDIIEVCA